MECPHHSLGPPDCSRTSAWAVSSTLEARPQPCSKGATSHHSFCTISFQTKGFPSEQIVARVGSPGQAGPDFCLGHSLEVGRGPEDRAGLRSLALLASWVGGSPRPHSLGSALCPGNPDCWEFSFILGIKQPCR